MDFNLSENRDILEAKSLSICVTTSSYRTDLVSFNDFITWKITYAYSRYISKYDFNRKPVLLIKVRAYGFQNRDCLRVLSTHY